MKLVEMSVAEVLRELGSPSPAPGGGSVAALAGAVAAALCQMVAALTSGREKLRESWPDMEKVRREAAALQTRLAALADEDAQAFRAVIEARRLPKGTEGEREARESALREAYLWSAKVPLSTLEALRDLSGVALRASNKGSASCVTDAGCAVQMIRAGAACAAYNVRVNLPSLREPVSREQVRAAAEKMLQETLDETRKTESIVESRLALLQAGA